MDADCISATKRLLENQVLVTGRGSREVANTLKKLSDLHIQNREFQEAEQCLLQALHIKIDLYGVEHEEILSMLEDLCMLYREQDRQPDINRVEEWQARVRRRINKPSTQQTVDPGPPVRESGIATLVRETRTANSRTPQQSMETTQDREPTCLTVESSGEKFSLKQRNVWLGRDKMNDLSFPENKSIEWSHALISYDEDGYWIVNRARAKATSVNGRDITLKTKLACNDLVQIGDISLRVS